MGHLVDPLRLIHPNRPRGNTSLPPGLACPESRIPLGSWLDRYLACRAGLFARSRRISFGSAISGR